VRVLLQERSRKEEYAVRIIKRQIFYNPPQFLVQLGIAQSRIVDVYEDAYQFEGEAEIYSTRTGHPLPANYRGKVQQITRRKENACNTC
jgi:hypothetical protein